MSVTCVTAYDGRLRVGNGIPWPTEGWELRSRQQGSNSRGLDGEMSKNADFLLRLGYQEGTPSPKE
jgi:hypothetical protein